MGWLWAGLPAGVIAVGCAPGVEGPAAIGGVAVGVCTVGAGAPWLDPAEIGPALEVATGPLDAPVAFRTGAEDVAGSVVDAAVDCVLWVLATGALAVVPPADSVVGIVVAGAVADAAALVPFAEVAVASALPAPDGGGAAGSTADPGADVVGADGVASAGAAVPAVPGALVAGLPTETRADELGGGAEAEPYVDVNGTARELEPVAGA